jgi:hypothetical protein
MKPTLLILLGALGAATAGAAVVGGGNAVPFSPVNHTGRPVVLSYIRGGTPSWFVVVAKEASGGASWIGYTAGDSLSTADGTLLTLDTSGTNANVFEFVCDGADTNQVDVILPTGLDAVNNAGISSVEWDMFFGGMSSAMLLWGFAWGKRLVAGMVGREVDAA